MVAGRFRALSEPTRLAVLHALESGPLTVTELVVRTGLGQGNVSKHLQQLFTAGFVSRTRKGLFVHYALADEDVLELCEMMCGRLESDLAAASATLTSRIGA
jgi:DNA-binding transcriptional ArsR family regulator